MRVRMRKDEGCESERCGEGGREEGKGERCQRLASSTWRAIAHLAFVFWTLVDTCCVATMAPYVTPPRIATT